MNKLAVLFIPAVFLTLISSAFAVEIREKFPLRHALDNEKVKNVISSNIPLYWGDQKHPAVKNEIGKFATSRHAKAFGKSSEQACEWALASAIIELQNRTHRKGGNAIINIKSNLKNEPRSSATDYDCLRNGMKVSVALEGTIVTLGK